MADFIEDNDRLCNDAQNCKKIAKVCNDNKISSLSTEDPCFHTFSRFCNVAKPSIFSNKINVFLDALQLHSPTGSGRLGAAPLGSQPAPI